MAEIVTALAVGASDEWQSFQFGNPQLSLELGNARRQGWLRNGGPFSPFGEAAGFRHGKKTAKLVYLHP